MKNLIGSIIVFISVFLSQNATALLISVDPDPYITGTDISSSYSGVTLSVVGSSVDSGYIASEVYSVSTPSATTGTQLFGNKFGPNLYTQGWNLGSQAMRVDFLNPVNVVSIDMRGRNTANGVMAAYNSDGILVDTFSALLSSLDDFETARIHRNSYDISYVLIGSSTSDGVRLDNFRYNTRVPEPSSLALVFLGIAVLGFSRQRNT
jgi:hypothetical protein